MTRGLDFATPARQTADRGHPCRYVAGSCRVGNHLLCRTRSVVSCTCPCHRDIYSVVWRAGDYVIVTYTTGEIELQPGRLTWAEELAETVGLMPVPGTLRGREEWIREPDVFIGLAPSMADVTDFGEYVSVACDQVEGHPVSEPRSGCGCRCHADVSHLVWRVGDLIIVTFADGEVDRRPGTLKRARDLADHLGLKLLSGTPVGREEWAREP